MYCYVEASSSRSAHIQTPKDVDTSIRNKDESSVRKLLNYGRFDFGPYRFIQRELVVSEKLV